MKEYKYVIVGGGIAGLITSIELSKHNSGKILLLEKEDELGGYLKTIERNGFKYDIGSHIIHEEVDENTLDYINKVAGNVLTKNKRTGKLIFRKSYITYPLKSIKFMAGLGGVESIYCSMSLLFGRFLKLLTKFKTKKKSNYEYNLKQNVGVRAYDIFYKPYALKVWNCDPRLISKTAIKRQMAMVGPLTLFREFVNYTFKKKHDKYFYYLEGGIGKFPEGLERTALESNVDIYKSVTDFKIDNQILEIDIDGKKETISFDKLISTTSLTSITSKLNFSPSEKEIVEKVEYRGLKLIFLHVSEEVLVDGESFYLPETKYSIGRISIPCRFSEAMNPNTKFTSIICEIPCSKGDKIWNMDTQEVVAICLKDLKEAGLIKGDNYSYTDYDFHFNVPDVYPLYYNHWQTNIKSILKIVGDKYPNIYLAGKSGFFMQSNLDRSIEIGKELPRKLVNNITPNEWYERFDYYHSLILRD